MYPKDALRILIVDDEDALGRAMQIALSFKGWDVVCTQGGEQAYGRLQHEHFDVMVLDLLMPDMRGDVFFFMATSVQPHLAQSTLFVTGDITKHADELIADCGCDLLRKPFDLDDLVGLVEKLAPRRARESA
jgi:DNA-binding NtrC family response regulator